MNAQARVLLVVLLLVVGVKVGREAHSWLTHGPERARFGEVRERLLDAGVEVVRTRARADTLRVEFERMDRALEPDQSALDAYQERMRSGALSPPGYAAYRDRVLRYNRKVEQLNAQHREVKEARERARRAEDRYHALADSARSLARVLGDPYYATPSPLEAAVKRGVIRVEP